MDSSEGVVKWSARRAREHIRAVSAGALAIPLAAAIAGIFIALPSHPTVAERVTQAAESLGVGFLIVLALAFIYAFTRAPYEQRAVLRAEAQALDTKYNDAVDETYRGLTLSDISIQREVLPSDPNVTVRLNVHLRYRNDTNAPLEYSVHELSFKLGNKVFNVNPDVANTFRVWPNRDDGYIFWINLDPPLAGGFEGAISYTVWYGPTTANDTYEQSYTYVVRDTLTVNSPSTSGRFWRDGSIGHDKRREAVPARHLEATPTNMSILSQTPNTALVQDRNIQFFSENGMWHKPPGAARVEVLIKGGDGGSSIGEDGNIIPGSEGEVVLREFPADQLPETAEIKIGEAGRGSTQGNLKAPDGRPGYAVVITYLVEGTAKPGSPS